MRLVWKKRALVVLAALVSMPASADILQVSVLARDKTPVEDVAVFVRQVGVESTGTPAAAVMAQQNVQFDPHLLVVQKGGAVSFPNNDVIAHHVYSFSKPNDFLLPLYKGTPSDPVVFEHDGIVTLGCNIHDGMLGYIVVVDTDVFGKTNSKGNAELEVDSSASAWEVSVWSPRFRGSDKPLMQTVTAGEKLDVTFELKLKLRPSHDEQSESVQWDDYD